MKMEELIVKMKLSLMTDSSAKSQPLSLISQIKLKPTQLSEKASTSLQKLEDVSVVFSSFSDSEEIFDYKKQNNYFSSLKSNIQSQLECFRQMTEAICEQEAPDAEVIRECSELVQELRSTLAERSKDHDKCAEKLVDLNRENWQLKGAIELLELRLDQLRGNKCCECSLF